MMKRALLAAGVLVMAGAMLLTVGKAMGGDGHRVTWSQEWDWRVWKGNRWEPMGEEDEERQVSNTEKSVSAQKLKELESLDFDLTMSSVEIREGDYFLEVKDGTYTDLKVTMEDGKLSIVDVNQVNLNWNFSAKGGQVVLTLPKEKLLKHADLYIGMGDLDIDRLSAESLDLDLNMGSCDARFLEAEEAEIHLSMGDIEVADGAFERLQIENSMGNISLRGIFGEKTLLKDSMGSIDLTILGQREEYTYDLHCGMGDIHFAGEKKADSQQYQGEKEMKIDNSMGDISVSFS